MRESRAIEGAFLMSFDTVVDAFAISIGRNGAQETDSLHCMPPQAPRIIC